MTYDILVNKEEVFSTTNYNTALNKAKSKHGELWCGFFMMGDYREEPKDDYILITYSNIVVNNYH
jgi:hypothetical protein